MTEVHPPLSPDDLRRLEEWLDAALEQTFPASDPLPAFRTEPGQITTDRRST
ncbi:MAG: hypothetical protein HC872_05455 [Gammaproteobacteria bacterium]|nr:hypothetical protein [Gammaproteobacteria bacterium]